METAFEVEQRRRDIILFPIRLDYAVMTASTSWAADIRRARQIGDFSEWKNPKRYTEAFSRLLRDLQREVNEEAIGTKQTNQLGRQKPRIYPLLLAFNRNVRSKLNEKFNE